ncbi:MAG: tyrosine-type recombinase/integrase [Sporichthyaceae bacterium]
MGEVAQAYLDGKPSWSASTRLRNTVVVSRYVVPRWGSVPVSAVTYEAVQAWVGTLSAPGLGRAGGALSGASVRKIVGVFASILDVAVKSKRLASNPVRAVDLPKAALTRRRYLTGAQVESFADAAGEHRDLVLVLAYTGLRFGEMAALRGRHVDMLRRRLRIEESVTDVNGSLVWSSPKDHQRRSVPFPPFLAEPLSRRLSPGDPDALVFATARGAVLRTGNMRSAWFDAAATAAGLEGLTPHELRHTAASLAVSAGASVLALQRMLGHAKPSMTLDVYSDLFDEDLDALAERLADSRARILADCLRTPTMEPPATVREIGR